MIVTWTRMVVETEKRERIYKVPFAKARTLGSKYTERVGIGDNDISPELVMFLVPLRYPGEMSRGHLVIFPGAQRSCLGGRNKLAIHSYVDGTESMGVDGVT